MQFKNIALAGFISLASAASSDSNVTAIASQLPSCATSCLTTGAASAGCGATDYSCQCDNKATIETNATSCLTTSCSVTDITSTQKVVTEICEEVSGNTTSSTASNSSTTGTSTGTSSSSAASSSSSSSSSSAGSRPELYGLGWAAVVGIVGLLAL